MCKETGCDSKPRSRGLCQKHYMRLYRHKDTKVASIHNPPTGLQAFFVVLNYMDDMSQRETAKTVGISRWQVAKILKS